MLKLQLLYCKMLDGTLIHNLRCGLKIRIHKRGPVQHDDITVLL